MCYQSLRGILGNLMQTFQHQFQCLLPDPHMSIFNWFSNLPLLGNSSQLCTACQNGDLATVRKLATAELVNTIGWMGWAPLHKAAQGAHSEIVEFLLVSPELKTDVNIRDSDNHTALILACGVRKEDLTENNTKSIHLLLAGGANVNAEDDGGYSSLDVAVINNNLEAVQLLIEYKANVNHINQDRFTPLHSACRYHYQDIATMLVKNGADISIPDGQGRTPIQLAQRYGIDLTVHSEVPEANPSQSRSAHLASNSNIPQPDSASSSSSSSTPQQQHATPTQGRSPNVSESDRSPPVLTTPSEVTQSLQRELEAELESV